MNEKSCESSVNSWRRRRRSFGAKALYDQGNVFALSDRAVEQLKCQNIFKAFDNGRFEQQ